MTGFEHKTKRRPAGIYILPSMLTAMGMFSGFYSILISTKNIGNELADFYFAGVAILIAGFLDGLDGRMARLMKAESEFGVQFDSIADIVSFGVAPAVLLYACGLHEFDRYGIATAFLFVACAGIRLARFNVLTAQGTEKKYFKGLASPLAAGGLSLLVMILHPYDYAVSLWVIGGAGILFSILMVSNIRFRSFKKLEAARRRRSQIFILVVFLIWLIFSFQEHALFGIFIVYVVWGLLEELYLFRRRRRSDPNVPFVFIGEKPNQDEESIL